MKCAPDKVASMLSPEQARRMIEVRAARCLDEKNARTGLRLMVHPALWDRAELPNPDRGVRVYATPARVRVCRGDHDQEFLVVEVPEVGR